MPDVVFMPKALILLSHYAFHNAWRVFLQQLYRISLAGAPLPIERYISNFVCELPLPPKGQVEVKFGFIDKSCTISRPPKNKLPLTDFSYRPLFGTLSVSNILTVFGCLLVETRVAFCSKHYSMLGPVAEGFVALLFPFVWQGAYIPIMPSSMTDILDAPVPFIVGIHSRYLDQVNPADRPRGVVFVDLDNDVVHLGNDDDSPHRRVPPKLPEREASKLKEKLLECGAPAYLQSDRPSGIITTGGGEFLANNLREAYAVSDRASELALLQQQQTLAGARGGQPAAGGKGGSSSSAADGGKHGGAGGGKLEDGSWRASALRRADLAFPSNEHLLPINTFATEQGMVLSKSKVGGAAGRPSAEAARSGYVEQSLVGIDALNLLDTAANENGSDGFSAKEIRNAFLRFFVSIFRYYDKFVSTNETKPFNREAFLKESSHLNSECHEYVTMCLQSQMFERFIEERIENSNQPEIRFFNESIIQKLNRSAKSGLTKKKDTPFLSDSSDIVSETFNPPPPSNWGLPDDGRVYVYSSFPHLKPELFGKIRPPRHLLRGPEQQRTVHDQHKLISKMLTDGGRGAGGAAGLTKDGKPIPNSILPPRPRDLEWALNVLVFKENTLVPTTTGQRKQPALPQDGKDANMFVTALRAKQQGVVNAVTRLQAKNRSKGLRKRFLQEKKAAKFIQGCWRGVCILRTYRGAFLDVVKIVKVVQRVFRGFAGRLVAAERRWAIMTIQRYARGLKVRQNVAKMNLCAKRLQAAERGRRARFAWTLIRELIVTAQAHVRGWFKRKIAAKERKERLAEYRAQIFQLWRRAHTPLAYRSRFWLLFDGSGFLHVAVHEDELLRLWRDLGVFDSDFAKKAFAMMVEHYSSMGSSGSLGGVGDDHHNAPRPTMSPRLFDTYFKSDHRRSVSDLTADSASSSSSSSPEPGPNNSGHAAGGFSVPDLYSNNSKVLFLRRFRVVAMQLEHATDIDVTTPRPIFSAERGAQAAAAATAAANSGFKNPFLSSPDKNLATQQTPEGRHLTVASERVKLERNHIYEKMKYGTSDFHRSTFFHMFDIKENEKKKKQRLVELLWEVPEQAVVSAQVVLGVNKATLAVDMTTGAGKASSATATAGKDNEVIELFDAADAGSWVQAKLERRIRNDLLSTVQACITSIQLLKEKEIEAALEKRARSKDGGMYVSPGKRGSNAAGTEEHNDWVVRRATVIDKMLTVGGGKGDRGSQQQQPQQPQQQQQQQGSGSDAPPSSPSHSLNSASANSSAETSFASVKLKKEGKLGWKGGSASPA